MNAVIGRIHGYSNETYPDEKFKQHEAFYAHLLYISGMINKLNR